MSSVESGFFTEENVIRRGAALSVSRAAERDGGAFSENGIFGFAHIAGSVNVRVRGELPGVHLDVAALHIQAEILDDLGVGPAADRHTL